MLFNLKLFLMLSAILMAVSSYRIEDRVKSDLQALARDVEEMEAVKDEKAFPEKREAHECKYSGASCNNVYSYGCQDIKKRCVSGKCSNFVSSAVLFCFIIRQAL